MIQIGVLYDRTHLRLIDPSISLYLSSVMLKNVKVLFLHNTLVLFTLLYRIDVWLIYIIVFLIVLAHDCLLQQTWIIVFTHSYLWIQESILVKLILLFKLLLLFGIYLPRVLIVIVQIYWVVWLLWRFLELDVLHKVAIIKCSYQIFSVRIDIYFEGLILRRLSW